MLLIYLLKYGRVSDIDLCDSLTGGTYFVTPASNRVTKEFKFPSICPFVHTLKSIHILVTNEDSFHLSIQCSSYCKSDT